MTFGRRSPVTGKMAIRHLPDVKFEDYYNWAHRGMHIQNAMPHISADDREWLISGCLPEEFNALFPEE